MVPYEQLTDSGKRRRLFKVAELATKQYDFEVKHISFLVEETNIFYKIIDRLGNQYALKIFQEESSTLEDNLAEVYFVDLVSRTNKVTIPSVIQAKDGNYIQVITSKYTPEPKRVALYEWMEGEDLDGNENEHRFMQFGELTAHLHNSTYDISIPNELSPKSVGQGFLL
jgi:Ser/Thr protein kinase RdoA (MazF antagonist)